MIADGDSESSGLPNNSSNQDSNRLAKDGLDQIKEEEEAPPSSHNIQAAANQAAQQ